MLSDAYGGHHVFNDMASHHNTSITSRVNLIILCRVMLTEGIMYSYLHMTPHECRVVLIIF